MKTKVKICGIRTIEHARAAIDAGADFIGFNFVPTSKRYIEPEKAKEIIDKLRIENGQLTIALVGVFQDQSIDEVNTSAEHVGLDFVQLHGEEDSTYISKISNKIIKKIDPSAIYQEESGIMNHELRKRKKEMLDSYFLLLTSGNVQYFLLDRQIQGQGEMVDVEKAKEIAKEAPLFFAGGLTPENVAMVITQVKPFAVDVAGGVETDSDIDPEKVKRFVQQVKGVI